jgi:GNAT superfamily N-acetyltransferase
LISITEEPYDGPVATELVGTLMAELNERYADVDHLDHAELPEEAAEGDAAYLAEVTAEQTTRPRGVFLVAWEDGDVVGCGALKPLDKDPSCAEIKRMYTAPPARGKGVGRAILERLEAVAAELGYREVLLETGLAQPEAMALYASHGWHRIEPYGHHRESPWSVSFAKVLDPP